MLDYDHYIVYFSGGKDSIACFLHLLEIGVPKEKIELWHHLVDGREGSELMDWAVTEDYCRKFAAAFNVPIYFSWKVGGFEGEMLRENALTAPTKFETPEGVQQIGGTRGKRSTRRKFPQVSANLSVRWCSVYTKIDPGAAAIRNQPRFKGKRVLTVSGERAEESAARAKYKTFEPDRSHGGGRHVDRWRPVHIWTEQQVWDILERHNINAHPAYHLGWGRVSCMKCIFGSHDQWASIAAIDPEGIETLADYETEFQTTIHRTLSIPERVRRGKAYEMDQEMSKKALSNTYYDAIIIYPFVLPQGAFGDSCGPT